MSALRCIDCGGHAAHSQAVRCWECARPSFCSACGRRLREKRIASGYMHYFIDWLNHRRDCPRYGQEPDA